MPNIVYDALPQLYAGKPDIRERMSGDGVSALADYELLAAILGTGTKGRDVQALAKDLLERHDLSAGVPPPGAFTENSGLGLARACKISAALELGRRYYGHRSRRVSSPEDVWALVRHFDDGKQERFICCTLNGAHDVMNVRVITVGLVNRTIVHPREVYAEAITSRACAVIVAHNHPSGRLEPSPEDLDITSRIKQAGEILGITLLDHVIFSADSYVSLVELGQLSVY